MQKPGLLPSMPTSVVFSKLIGEARSFHGFGVISVTEISSDLLPNK